jgi:type I restriction enzyme S subunit
MTLKEGVVEIGELIQANAIVAIQDGNHGEKHPKASDYVDDGISFVMANDLNKGLLTPESTAKITENLADKLRIGFSVTGDVLLTHKGTIGNTAIVPEVSPYVMLTPQVTYYRTNPEILNNYYLMYCFRESGFQKVMASLAQQSTRPYIGVTAQRKLKVFYRDIDAQTKIVDQIKPYDDLINNNCRRIQILEDTLRLLFREWFVSLQYPGHEGAKVVNGLPEGWKKLPLKNICNEIKETISPEKVEPDTPYIGLEHMPRRSITLNEWGAAEKVTSTKLRFLPGDILFGKIRPYFHKVGFTMCGGITSSDSIVIRPAEEMLYYFCLLYLSSDFFVALASKTVKEGSKMPRADWAYLKTYDVIVPPEILLQSFNEQVAEIVNQLKVLSLQNKALVKVRDLLLPRLMNGDITV